MAPTPEQTTAGYRNLWNRAEITNSRREDAAALARRIVTNRARYEAVQRATGVPWPMIGALHSRESGLSFAGHLHNGDSLKGYTVHVPAKRPKVGHGPPFGWEESAVDALTEPAHRLDTVKRWSLERILYECERYNGWGYLGRTNSPYLWSWTSVYGGGKYVADHVFSAAAVDKQAGCVAAFKALVALDPDAAAVFAAAPREAAPPSDVIATATRKQRAARTLGTAGAAAGSGGEAVRQTGTVQHDAAKLAHPVLTGLAIATGLAVAAVAAVLILRRKRLLQRLWAGADAPAPGLLARAGATVAGVAARLVGAVAQAGSALRRRLAALIDPAQGG